MKLRTLLTPWLGNQCPDIDIAGIHHDSRKIHPNFAFFAYPGAVTDGRCYIQQALNAGATAIIYEPDHWPEGSVLPESSASIPFPGLASQLAALSSRFYDEPTKKMTVIGITGTNGKTTIAYQLAQAHELLGSPSAYIGTLGQGKVNALERLANTTPDALCLQQFFSQYLDKHIHHVSMEVSSHALAQGRVKDINFQQAIFTNLTLDHLDYHHTMENYAATKALLFAYPSLKWAIINHDDPYASLISASIPDSCKRLSYGVEEGCDVRAVGWEVSLDGSLIQVVSPWGKHQLRINALGFFNIYNALAVFSSLLAAGYDVEKIISVMALLKAAPGRMEIVATEPYVIVDYAHTPDALKNVLMTLNTVKKGRVLVVFGCGGDRDKSKRPIMGNIAAQYADLAIITSDNPRTEDPEQIIREIKAGVRSDTMIYSMIDRKEAIGYAMQLANKDDIILVAGKGHEDYQQIGDKRYAFSDQKTIMNALS